MLDYHFLRNRFMGYIDRNLLPDEKILFRTRKSIILFLFPALWTVASFYVASFMRNNGILVKLEMIPWGMAGLFWSYSALEYYSSEYAVTNKRVMMREGFFTRHSNEMRINAISQVNVDQSLIGQILNYGIVSINA
jgi:uncharacterized membrane protein YdbT with pleckstrin-like domain